MSWLLHGTRAQQEPPRHRRSQDEVHNHLIRPELPPVASLAKAASPQLYSAAWMRYSFHECSSSMRRGGVRFCMDSGPLGARSQQLPFRKNSAQVLDAAKKPEYGSTPSHGRT